jgi:hypothetical protein
MLATTIAKLHGIHQHYILSLLNHYHSILASLSNIFFCAHYSRGMYEVQNAVDESVVYTGMQYEYAVSHHHLPANAYSFFLSSFFSFLGPGINSNKTYSAMAMM